MEKTSNLTDTHYTKRNSNLELFRIITMLLIIAHHYIVNSGLMSAGTAMWENPYSLKVVFLWLFGAWGKMGINCFVLITGYFMCKTTITAKKFVKLLFEVMFYKLLIFAIFVVTGYETLSVRSLLALLPVSSVGQNFVGCFLLFYLMIPFLNITIQNMKEKAHIRLVVLLCFIYVLLGTALGSDVQFNYITWYVVLYFVAAYIRMYPKACFNNTKLWAVLAAATFLASAASVVALHLIGQKVKVINGYSLMTDCNKIMAFVTALCGFMFFKNVKIKYNKVINTLGASTFGVLLIHSNSAAMRKFLWTDLLKVVEQYDSPSLVLLAVASVLGVFIACSVIDYLRIQMLEKPFFKLWDKHWPKIADAWKQKEKQLCNKLNIESEDP